MIFSLLITCGKTSGKGNGAGESVNSKKNNSVLCSALRHLSTCLSWLHLQGKETQGAMIEDGRSQVNTVFLRYDHAQEVKLDVGR